MLDKKIILAVAGSGKTSHVVKQLSLEKRVIIITYTETNRKNLRLKVLKNLGFIPENIRIITYFAFLFSFCYRPFLAGNIKAKGLYWGSPPRFIANDKLDFYMSTGKYLYHNRLSKLLMAFGAVTDIKKRLERYCDLLLIDEFQDFGGHDFNFIKTLGKAKINMIFVGDFFQHTYDTSRDGSTNKNLHRDLETYKKNLKQTELTLDDQVLGKSHRCSPTICRFISEKLAIPMESHRNDETRITLVERQDDVEKLMKMDSVVKLFYQEHYKHRCFSQNWGDSKGRDDFDDVCVILNPTTFQKYKAGRLLDLAPQTRNKFYVACTRARKDLFFIPQALLKK